MIVSQTPYRVSFAGGGTDLPGFYRKEPGAVLSLTLACHVYVMVSPRFEPSIRIGYHETELVSSVNEIRHPIVRESLRSAGLACPLEIATVGDVPGGTGLGSSSALAVGLLNALHAFSGRMSGPRLLAEQACAIEIDALGQPIGRQDQYAAAFGGVNHIRFNSDDSVDVEPVACRNEVLDELELRALLLYTEHSRDAGSILAKQNAAIEGLRPALRQMRDLAEQMRGRLLGHGDLDGFAQLLHQSWCLKRGLGLGIATPKLDCWYERARAAGAQGGKLLGAGGGGFLLLLARPEQHGAIRAALGYPRELPFRIDGRGSRIVLFNDERSSDRGSSLHERGRSHDARLPEAVR